jgi:dihydroorotate dehydrogenase (fumarate)
MTDLTTRWLGFDLESPLIIGASPLTDDVDALAACVDAGASAIVMRSLFEEQLVAEQLAAHRYLDSHVDMDAEARTFLADTDVFSLGPEPYLKQLARLRARLGVPVIASLNGVTPGGWTDLAARLAGAGASALELNLYEVAADPEEDATHLERRHLHTVETVVAAARIPVAVKLSTSYSALPNFVKRLGEAGATGVVVFNRFYQPDIDLDHMDVLPTLHLSTSLELPLRLHALAILSHRTPLDLALTGGVHSGDDAVKAILCGAHAVQMVSHVLKHGPAGVRAVVDGMRTRLESMGYRNLGEARGAMDLGRSPDPHAWERVNYMKMLRGWRGVLGS